MRDEQIEVWFESIENQLKEIRKSQSSDHSEEVHKKIQTLFDDFIIKMRSIRLNVPQQDFTPLMQKIDSVLQEAKRISQPIMATHVKTEHYFLFFPDLKSWLHQLKRAKFLWLLALLLCGSLCLNWYFYKDHECLQTNDLKLRYMRYQGSIQFVAILNNIDSAWAVPKFRDEAIKSIKRYESSSLQEKERQNRINDLEKELNGLKSKP
jgi:hypothetical protein